jgi:1-acyl-sn-glycerol-3-phosphate acyltransferase
LHTIINDIKFFLFILLNGLGLILISLACIIMFALPSKTLFKIAALWAPYSCWLMDVVLGVKIKVRGESHIPNKPCIIAANHQTTYDGIIFDNILPRHSYVAKKSIVRIPIFGWLFSLTRPIFIDRNKKKKAMKQIIRKGIKRMGNGISVIIFPEGERTHNGKINKYKKGCAVLSWSSRKPILPIYHNACTCFSRSGKYIGPGTITIIIGIPIMPTRRTVNEINESLFSWTKRQEFSNRGC